MLTLCGIVFSGLPRHNTSGHHFNQLVKSQITPISLNTFFARERKSNPSHCSNCTYIRIGTIPRSFLVDQNQPWVIQPKTRPIISRTASRVSRGIPRCYQEPPFLVRWRCGCDWHSQPIGCYFLIFDESAHCWRDLWPCSIQQWLQNTPTCLYQLYNKSIWS